MYVKSKHLNIPDISTWSWLLMGNQFCLVLLFWYCMNDPKQWCWIYLAVATMLKLTNNANRIFEANVTNSFQACCSVSDNVKTLSFKNQNANVRAFKCCILSLCIIYIFWENGRNLPKTGGRKLPRLKGICYILLHILLAFFINFDILVTLRELWKSQMERS